MTAPPVRNQKPDTENPDTENSGTENGDIQAVRTDIQASKTDTEPASGSGLPPADELTPDSPASAVLAAHLTEQVNAMTAREPQARLDEPDSVHKMRVATRRLRSALATFRPLLNRDRTEPLRDELKWIAGELGAARDAEVLRMRLSEELAAEPDHLVLGPIASLIDIELRAVHRKAHRKLVLALDSERYRKLVDELEALVADPPLTDLADGPADVVLTRRVRKSFKRVKTLVSAGPPADLQRRDEWYHEIRKASKRLRYAAESVAPAFGAPATGLADAAENLQEVLGEHQDSVVARTALRQLGVRIHLDGDSAFTIGRLHALEQGRGEEALREFDAAWSAVSGKKLRRWLRK